MSNISKNTYRISRKGDPMKIAIVQVDTVVEEGKTVLVETVSTTSPEKVNTNCVPFDLMIEDYYDIVASVFEAE